MGSHTSLHDAGNRRRHLRGYHHGPGENRRPVNRLNTQPENNLHHALGHYLAKIVDVVDRLFAGVLDDLAQSGFVGGQVLAAKIGVRDTPCGAGCFEHVEMRVGPAHGHLQCQVQPVQPDISRHLQGAGDSGLDVLQGDFDLDDAHAASFM